MTSENTRPTSQRFSGIDRYGSSNWAIVYGLLAALLIGGMLYVAFSGDLIDARSTAIPSPPAASAPVDARPVTSMQPSVPSTR
jgi:hypothetical protein